VVQHPDVLSHRVGGAPVRAADGGPELALTDPWSGEVVARAPVGGEAEADAAVAAARKAAGAWARTDPAVRGQAISALADLVRAHADQLAQLQTRENGKPLHMSRGDVDAAAGSLAQYAQLGPLHRGRSLQGTWGATDLMVHEPRGVAALIIPWNDPLGILAGLLGATVVAGNSVVVKPSERATAAVARLVELADEAGLPPGVVNLLLGDASSGAALVAHAGVDLVAHVGSVSTGRRIAEACAGQLKKALLELGGKDPLIVDAGVDPRWAARQAATGAFANAGQICTSVERIYVHADVAAEFVEALVDEAESQVLGDPADPATTMGPLVDSGHRDAVHAHVTAALQAGAVLRAGGVVPKGPGAVSYPATVLTEVTEDMAVLRDETFGPVAPVRVVSSFDEALQLACDSGYGLAASVLTPSQAHAQRAWRELPAGTVKINDVWGGAPGGSAEPHRGSGLGFGYGPELLDEVTLTKVVHLSPAL